jgi:hypothetical protein
VQLDVGGGGAGQALDRRGQAEELVDGVADPPRFLDQAGPLAGVGGEQLGGPTQEAGGRVVAARHHREGEPEHLEDAHLVGAGRHQPGDRVVAWFVAPPLGQPGEVVEQLAHGVARRQGVAPGGGGDDGLGPAVEPGTIGGRHAQVMGDDHARQRLEQLRHDVTLAVVAQQLDPLGDEGPHLGLDLGHPPGCEAAGHQSAERRVLRRVEHDERRRLGEPDRLPLAVAEAQALGGRERGGVPAARNTSSNREITQ